MKITNNHDSFTFGRKKCLRTGEFRNVKTLNSGRNTQTVVLALWKIVIRFLLFLPIGSVLVLRFQDRAIESTSIPSSVFRARVTHLFLVSGISLSSLETLDTQHAIIFFFFRSHDEVNKWKHFPRYCPFVRVNPTWIPSQRQVTRSCDAFSDLRLNKGLSRQSRHRWFETPSHHYVTVIETWHFQVNVITIPTVTTVMRNCELVCKLASVFKFDRALMATANRPTSWWWLQIPWCNICPRPPATTMMTQLYQVSRESNYRQTSISRRTKSPKKFSSRLAVVFVQSIEARC